MLPTYLFLSPQSWSNYELIDCGNFEKLERFGEFILARPEPQAIWNKKLSENEWNSMVNAKYIREKGRADIVLTSEKGSWSKKTNIEKWKLRYKSDHLDLIFNLSLTSFGHIGIFPEQAKNWEFIFQNVKKIQQPKVLNLFAYTGAASLAACAAGAEVVHVDSVKQSVAWAKENKESSKLSGVIRWIVDDVMKFVKREVRRGNRYHGIILDPPAYGRGTAGEKWLLDQHLNELLHECAQILNQNQKFFLLNIYSVGFSAVVLDSLTNMHFKNENKQIGELILTSKTNIHLPMGTFLRFSNI